MNTKFEYEQKPLVPQITQEQLDIINQYGSCSDEFYKSKGLDPIKERQKVKEFYESKNLDPPEELKKYFPDDVKTKPKKYKPKKGPKLKQQNKDSINTTNSASSLSTESIEENIENVSEKTSKGLETKNLTDASTEAIEEGVEKTTKNINWGKIGKIGAVVTAIGVGTYAIGKHNGNKKEKKEERQQQTPNYQTHVASTAQASYNNSLLYNSYAQQMASDISSYRYGKHVTGFV